MPVEYHDSVTRKDRYLARKKKKEYWMQKGCSERKAEELLFRYGY